MAMSEQEAQEEYKRRQAIAMVRMEEERKREEDAYGYGAESFRWQGSVRTWDWKPLVADNKAPGYTPDMVTMPRVTSFKGDGHGGYEKVTIDGVEFVPTNSPTAVGQYQVGYDQGYEDGYKAAKEGR